MTTTTGPRPLTEAEREAYTLHLQKVPVPSIQIKTGLQPAQIAAAVDLAKVHARLTLTAGAASGVAAPSSKPKEAAQELALEPAADDRLTTTRLLKWAEDSGVSRAATLAARIRTQLDELKTLHQQHDARTKAQAEVDRLTAELEAAKAALKGAGGIQPRAVRQPGAKPDEQRREKLAAIRAWAPGAGFEISPLGRIPRHVVDAYEAAHGGAQ